MVNETSEAEAASQRVLLPLFSLSRFCLYPRIRPPARRPCYDAQFPAYFLLQVASNLWSNVSTRSRAYQLEMNRVHRYFRALCLTFPLCLSFNLPPSIVLSAPLALFLFVFPVCTLCIHGPSSLQLALVFFLSDFEAHREGGSLRSPRFCRATMHHRCL